MKHLQTPLSSKDIAALTAGEQVFIDGIIYTARDAAHKRMIENLNCGKPLPIDISDQIIFYMGPCPAAPGEIIGPAGPTTSHRMDAYTPLLLDRGLKGMIGKGNRTKTVIEAIKEKKAVYFSCVGGTGSLCADHIQSVEIIAYDDLGTEAIRKLRVKDFPVIVAIDAKGNNIYQKGIEKYRNYINGGKDYE